MELIIKCTDKDIEELFKNRFPDMDKITKDFWQENEKGKLKDEIQDLKMENDRLKQREDKMIRALKAICCHMDKCDDCLFKKHNLKCESSASDIAIANITLKELEDL